jgi:hypothetical protein
MRSEPFTVTHQIHTVNHSGALDFVDSPSLPLPATMAQRADEPELDVGLRRLAVCSASWAGHPDVKA